MAKYNGHSNGNGKNWRTDPNDFADLVTASAKVAVQDAIADHHRAGNPVAIWRDGQIVLLYPDGSTRPVDAEESPLPAASAE
jgi:hypothetical protein